MFHFTPNYRNFSVSLYTRYLAHMPRRNSSHVIVKKILTILSSSCLTIMREIFLVGICGRYFWELFMGGISAAPVLLKRSKNLSMISSFWGWLLSSIPYDYVYSDSTKPRLIKNRIRWTFRSCELFIFSKLLDNTVYVIVRFHVFIWQILSVIFYRLHKWIIKRKQKYIKVK